MATTDDHMLERVQIQRKYGMNLEASAGTQTMPITVLTRDSEPLFVLPDGDRHERRIQRAIPSGSDRLFWATITVACGSPGRIRGKRTKPVASLAKRYGHLAKARNDLNAYYQY